MAPRQAPMATAASLPASIAPQPSDDLVAAVDFSRTKLLKRPREATPTSPTSGSASGDLSPSKIARLVACSPGPLTGAAALEDERRRRDDEKGQQEQQAGTSENPGQRALADLMSGGAAAAISRLQDAPLLRSATDAASKALDPVHFPGEHAASDKMQEASQQRAGGGGLDGTNDVAPSPNAMDVDPRMYAPQPEAQMDDRTATSLSYPGVRSGDTDAAPPSRCMSMPIATSQAQELAPRSPGSKKHKCPYCDTEFTRHHNLKSHLLTHSQEKPYACQTCDMRFRRLHDLKRHGKLHTGEKPHVCPKCDRKFARGDALARHSKGAGGCAGRKASGGNFGGDDEYDGVNASEADESAMTGVVYETSEADMTEDDRRRLTLPVPQSQAAAGQVLEGPNSTYPPAATRSAGGLYPPNVSRGVASAGLRNGLPMVANATVYGQNAMTESPKPLDPAGVQAIRSHPAAFPTPQEQHSAAGPSQSSPGSGQNAMAGVASGKQASRVRASTGAAQNHGGDGEGAGDNNSNNLFASGNVWEFVSVITQQHEALRELFDETQRQHEESQRSSDERVGDLEKHVAELTEEVAMLKQQLQEYQQAAAAQP